MTLGLALLAMDDIIPKEDSSHIEAWLATPSLGPQRRGRRLGEAHEGPLRQQ